MIDSTRQLISEEAAKLIVKYDFEKIKSDSEGIVYQSLFDQRILAARNIELIKEPFGIDFSIFKSALGTGISASSNYALKIVPDSSWDNILTAADIDLQTYMSTGQSSYYTKAMNLLQDIVINEFSIINYEDVQRTLSRKASYESADFIFQILTHARLDMTITVSVRKDIKYGKFEFNIKFAARASEILGANIKEQFDNLDLAITEIKKYTSILTK